MKREVVGYGVFKSEHKDNVRWLTGPVLEGDSIARFTEVWYGPDAPEKAREWVLQKAGGKELTHAA